MTTTEADGGLSGPVLSDLPINRLDNPAPRLRIFVVTADPPMFRRGLAAVIDADPGLQWVGEALSGTEASNRIVALKPDVLLVDATLADAPLAAGGTLLAQLRALSAARLVVLAEATGAAWPDRSAQGVSSTVAKSAAVADLLDAVHAAWHAQAPAPPRQANALPAESMTRRECQLLDLMARGLSNQEIALRMDIAVPTVKFHVTNVLCKLRVDNRTAAVLAALRLKLVQLD